MAHVETPLVSVRGLGKRFSGVTALTGIDLDITPGTVHALVGENGAGKSTLGKVIAGVVRPDDGEMRVDGVPVTFRSPADALAAGIAAIQQEIALVPARTAVENVFLGREPRRRGLPDARAMRRRFDELRESLRFNVSPIGSVGVLRTGEQQKVEIMRAVARDARLVVMDEPTAALGVDEVEHLLAAIKRLRERGTTIVFVSHRLEEVKEIADAITVLRNGELVTTRPAAEISAPQLVEAMLGRSLQSAFPTIAPCSPDAPVVLSARGVRRSDVLRDVSLEIRAGEIVGLAGLVGSGRSELARALFGADQLDAGTVEVDGEPVVMRSPKDAIDAGIALIPESRKDEGLFVDATVARNVTMAHLHTITRRGVVQPHRERAEVARAIDEFDIRPGDPRQIVGTLSGGNQQKVLFSKWLLRHPKVLIADEPTRGVDIGAKLAIYEIIAGLAGEGMGVLVISSELEEVLGLAHRVLVMRQGRIARELSREDANPERVMHAAFGTETAQVAA